MLRNGGRFAPEWMAGMRPESVAGMNRKTQLKPLHLGEVIKLNVYSTKFNVSQKRINNRLGSQKLTNN